MTKDFICDGTRTTGDWQRLSEPIAVLPVGAFEQHGAHLPLLTDTIKVDFFARHVAQDLGAALLPALAVTQSLEHAGFRGSLTLRPETFMSVIRDLADGLEDQHFTRLVIVNGHGGNWSLGPVVRDINRADRALKVVLVNYWECDHSPEGRKAREGEVHAGAWETSLMLAIAPGLVGDYAGVEPTAFEGNEKQSDLNHGGIGLFRPNGVWGDPRGASAETGSIIAESIKENLVEAVRERLAWFEREKRYAGAGPVAHRTLTAGDIDDALRLCRAAGWNQLRGDWALFRRCNPDGCFVAVHNGRVAGTVTTADYGQRVGWIAMILVDASMRRRGIGRALMERAMDALSPCGCIKLDATPAGKKLYDTLGFADEYELVRMCADNPAAPGEAGSVSVRDMDDSDVEEVLTLDERVFGVPRPIVIEGLRQLAPRYALVAEGPGGGIAGFSLGRCGENFYHIGPVSALGADIAQALADEAVRRAEGRACVMDVPLGQSGWIEWLHERGFRKQRSFVRMFRGDSAFPGIPEHTFSIAGPEFG